MRRTSKVIVLTLRDDTEEIVQKHFIKRVKEDQYSGYTNVTIHGSGSTPDYILKVKESSLEILKKLVSY